MRTVVVSAVFAVVLAVPVYARDNGMIFGDDIVKRHVQKDRDEQAHRRKMELEALRQADRAHAREHAAREREKDRELRRELARMKQSRRNR